MNVQMSDNRNVGGRPPKPPEEKKQQASVYLRPNTRQILGEISENLSEAIEKMAQEWKKKAGE